MQLFFAHGGHVLTDEECGYAAFGMGLLTAFLALEALLPSWRQHGRARWGRLSKAAPMSAIGCWAWTRHILIWTSALTAKAAKWQFLSNQAGWLIGGSALVVLGAACYDGFHNNP